MAINILPLATSLLLLYCGSEIVIRVASGLSSWLKISKVVVGTVFVASLTALPELLSSPFFCLFGSSRLALGNIIGSNIYNIPLIIGACCTVGGIKIKNSAMNKECYFMNDSSLLMITLLAITGMLTWWIGAVFIVLYPVFIYYFFHKGNCTVLEECKESNRSLMNVSADILLGGGALVIGTFLLVYSALSISEFLV